MEAFIVAITGMLVMMFTLIYLMFIGKIKVGEEEQFYYTQPTDKPIYTITVFNEEYIEYLRLIHNQTFETKENFTSWLSDINLLKMKKDMHSVGYFHSLDEALASVRSNELDLACCAGYEYVVIEEIYTGIYGHSYTENNLWFKYDEATDGFYQIEPPKVWSPI